MVLRHLLAQGHEDAAEELFFGMLHDAFESIKSAQRRIDGLEKQLREAETLRDYFKAEQARVKFGWIREWVKRWA